MILECKHQEQLCSWTIYSSRLAQSSKKWLLSTGGGQSCCCLCPGPAKAAVVALHRLKPAWNISPDILTGDQFKPSILPLYPAKIVIFFFLNQPLFRLFLSTTKDSQKKLIFFKVNQKFLIREQDIYSHLKKNLLHISVSLQQRFSQIHSSKPWKLILQYHSQPCLSEKNASLEIFLQLLLPRKYLFLDQFCPICPINSLLCPAQLISHVPSPLQPGCNGSVPSLWADKAPAL